MLGKLKRLLLEKLGINSIDQNLLLIRQAIEEKTCNLESRIINAERNICHQIDINRHEI
ncbi:MAG: hypothetical protein RL595_1962, partial [Planctomycetota bacterium]